MVNGELTFGIDPAGGDPLRSLALSYAPAEARDRVLALFALDATLRSIVARAHEPVVAQMRLAWWDDALRSLDARPPPPQPILRALADATTAGVGGADLAALIDGWERLLGEAPDDDGLLRFAQESGGRLFEQAAAIAGARDAMAGVAGKGWALAMLGEADPTLAARGRALAMASLRTAADHRWSRRGRFLGALVHAAQRPSSPVRVPRLAWHRLTGR